MSQSQCLGKSSSGELVLPPHIKWVALRLSSTADHLPHKELRPPIYEDSKLLPTESIELYKHKNICIFFFLNCVYLKISRISKETVQWMFSKLPPCSFKGYFYLFACFSKIVLLCWSKIRKNTFLVLKGYVLGSFYFYKLHA